MRLTFPKPVTIRLTPKQAMFLLLVMQDYIDVTDDRGVMSRALQIRRKLENVASPSTTVRPK